MRQLGYPSPARLLNLGLKHPKEKNNSSFQSKQSKLIKKTRDFVLKRFQNGLANSLDKDLAESALASSQATLSS